MMEQTKIFKALKGVRGRKPVDWLRWKNLLVRFSQLVVEQPWIKEIDINPLLASSGPAAGARRPSGGSRPGDDGRQTYPTGAIRPYPIHLV